MGARIAKLVSSGTPFAAQGNTVTFIDQNGIRVALIYEEARNG